MDQQKRKKRPNKATIQVFEETDHGKGLITCKDLDDLFEKLDRNE